MGQLSAVAAAGKRTLTFKPLSYQFLSSIHLLVVVQEAAAQESTLGFACEWNSIKTQQRATLMMHSGRRLYSSPALAERWVSQFYFILFFFMISFLEIENGVELFVVI